jgi:transposase
MLSAANVHDSMVFEELIDAIEPIKRPRGRPRKRPNKLLAAKAYDDKKCKGVLRKRRIKNRIARKGIESTEKLGRHRWIVERTLGWLSKYRRLTIRYERREDIHEAFLHLGCSLICLNYSTRWVLKGSLSRLLPLVSSKESVETDPPTAEER